MVLSPVDILYKNLGMRAELNKISKKEKFWRKNYIAVLRWKSSNMKVIMTRFTIFLIILNM